MRWRPIKHQEDKEQTWTREQTKKNYKQRKSEEEHQHTVRKGQKKDKDGKWRVKHDMRGFNLQNNTSRHLSAEFLRILYANIWQIFWLSMFLS